MGLIKGQADPGTGEPGRAADRDLESLIAALRDQDPEIRRRAALDLRDQRAAIPALLAAYPGEPDPATREALILTLAEHDDADVARVFIADLRLDDAAARNAAATALSAMPVAIGPLIDDLLGAPEVRVRVLAVSVLSVLDHPDVPRWLSAVVRDEPDENVVAAAVDAALAAGADTGALLGVALARFPANPYLGLLADTLASTP